MGAQLHLMLNHFPIVGMFFSMLIFIYIVFLKRESDDFRRFGIVFFFIICLTSIPVFITGNFAKSVVEGLPVFSDKFFEIHSSLAKVSTILSILFGLASLFFLVKYRKPRLVPFWVLLIVFASSIIASIFMGMTGSFGGKIMHNEIRNEKAFNPFRGRIYSKSSPFEKKFGDDNKERDRRKRYNK